MLLYVTKAYDQTNNMFKLYIIWIIVFINKQLELYRMKFFIDSANLDEIRTCVETGLVDGVTTNPSLIAQSGGDWLEVTKEICQMVDGPVSAEVTAIDHKTMLEEGLKLADIASNIAVKVPLTFDGLKTCYELANREIKVNVTLCFSANQALLAAKAGASFISPFLGRLDDIGYDGTDLIKDILTIYENYGYQTEILAASIRHAQHVQQVAKIGADIATMHPKIFMQLYKHPLTNSGLDQFTKDWASTGQSILEKAS